MFYDIANVELKIILFYFLNMFGQFKVAYCEPTKNRNLYICMLLFLFYKNFIFIENCCFE